MKITKLTIKNFQLFKDLELSLDNINLITGINLDDLGASGNASGKTTLINAILFARYGEVTGLTLKELIRTDTKNTSVSLYNIIDKDNYQIIRTIPTSLKIYKNGEEKEFSTNTLAQKYLDNLFGADINKFKMYHVIDNKKGINLLDLGTLSLRKQLMEFVDIYFSKIRANLLVKKLNRETYNIDKRLYTFHLSDKKLLTLENGLQTLNVNHNKFCKDYKNQNKIINNLKSEIQTRERLIYNKKKELSDAQKTGICPILKKPCLELKKELTPIQISINNQKIKQSNHEIEQFKSQLKNEIDYFKNLENEEMIMVTEIRQTESYIMKLKEAFKFKDYKYSKADVQLYVDSIKVLDQFASYYVQEWLSNLSLILNDLLQNVNLSIEFSTEKNFIKVKDNGQEFNYAQLSGGQKAFLNCIFKIGILLNEGINSGLLLIDEGLGKLDKINLEKLLDILKGLNYQCFVIYQNVNKDIKNVNFIEIIRKNGESKEIK